jgi:hypothetical protein
MEANWPAVTCKPIDKVGGESDGGESGLADVKTAANVERRRARIGKLTEPLSAGIRALSRLAEYRRVTNSSATATSSLPSAVAQWTRARSKKQLNHRIADKRVADLDRQLIQVAGETAICPFTTVANAGSTTIVYFDVFLRVFTSWEFAGDEDVFSRMPSENW